MGSVTIHPELCYYCKEKALIPGIIFPIATDGRDDHAYVEICDECRLFEDDYIAAAVLSAYLEMDVGIEERNHASPYIVGISFDEANKLVPQRYKFKDEESHPSIW